jgi:hypothetical protein
MAGVGIIVTHYKKSAITFRSGGYSGRQQGAPKIYSIADVSEVGCSRKVCVLKVILVQVDRVELTKESPPPPEQSKYW